MLEDADDPENCEYPRAFDRSTAIDSIYNAEQAHTYWPANRVPILKIEAAKIKIVVMKSFSTLTAGK